MREEVPRRLGVIIMFAVSERELREKPKRGRQEWWFTLEPNPVPEVKFWEAQIEGQWWVCDSDGKGNFHIVKYDRVHGKGIKEEGLFKWLCGFGISPSCVVKWRAIGVNRDVKKEAAAQENRLARERWMEQNAKK